ncbi:MAG: L,D-transpeptidase [Actinomycetota bacterium]
MTRHRSEGRTTLRLAAAAAGALLVLLASVIPAGAQEAPTVTLDAEPRVLRYGGSSHLSGQVSPPSADQTVNIIDETGAVVATAVTDEAGAYSVRLSPDVQVTVQAQWAAALSEPVTLKVRPIVKAALGDVLLFGRSRVNGSVKPAHPGESVRVRLYRNGNFVTSRRVSLREGRWFDTRFDIGKPGTYRATATLSDADHLKGTGRSGRKTTPLPSLTTGSYGRTVKLLEKRLVELNYHLVGINRRFDYRTADAMRAFNKVQGRARVGTVDVGAWGALARAHSPRARVTGAGFHVEVDQTKQVLYTVRDGKVTNAIHVSTGAGGATRDGSFRFYRKVYGYSGGGLYYPTYFDGLRAVHGWTSVPTYPASHGCVRVPYWTARWIQDKAAIGARIIIYH